MKFCDRCSGFLTIVTEKNEIYNKCYICNIKSKLDNKILAQSTSKENRRNEILSIAALYDDTYPVKKQKCNSCKNDIIHYFVDKKTYKNIYVCRKCKSYKFVSSLKNTSL